jgi:hypothetical protein
VSCGPRCILSESATSGELVAELIDGGARDAIEGLLRLTPFRFGRDEVGWSGANCGTVSDITAKFPLVCHIVPQRLRLVPLLSRNNLPEYSGEIGRLALAWAFPVPQHFIFSAPGELGWNRGIE